MTNRRFVVAIGAVFGFALGLRLLPLAWSPYPATLDGIGYAAFARDTLAAGRFPVGSMRADNFVFTGFLATTGAVLGLAPLRVAQPAVAFVGAASVVVAMAIGRRFGHDLGFDDARVRLGATVVGLGLAVDGLYLRRTGVPDEEALAFVLLPLLVLALHRGLRTHRPAWLGIAGLVLLAFPLTHTFSTLVAGTTLVAWLVAANRNRSTRHLGIGTAVVAGFWAYFAGYYDLTARLGMVVPYVDRITAHPGLFLAWLVAMVVGIWWFQRTSSGVQIAVVFAPVLLWTVIVLVNVVEPIFPGTVSSPLVLSLLLAVYLVPAALAAPFGPSLSTHTEGAVLILALFAAPVTLIGFSLTADLTPEFFGTAMRTQTFAHLPVIALAAVGTAGLVRRGHSLRMPLEKPVLVGLLLAALVITAPVAYVDLDTLAFPSTTTESEFRAAGFAAERVPGAWTSDHVLTRIAGHYFPSSPAIGPTAAWLHGNFPPTCPVLTARSWTTTGAHLFPAGPQPISDHRYRSTLNRRHLVYSSGDGYDSFALSVPTDPDPGC